MADSELSPATASPHSTAGDEIQRRSTNCGRELGETAQKYCTLNSKRGRTCASSRRRLVILPPSAHACAPPVSDEQGDVNSFSTSDVTPYLKTPVRDTLPVIRRESNFLDPSSLSDEPRA